MGEHFTAAPARPTDSTALTMYVKGDTRYMKIQNFGRALAVTRTLHSNLLLVPKLSFLDVQDIGDESMHLPAKQ